MPKSYRPPRTLNTCDAQKDKLQDDANATWFNIFRICKPASLVSQPRFSHALYSVRDGVSIRGCRPESRGAVCE